MAPPSLGSLLATPTGCPSSGTSSSSIRGARSVRVDRLPLAAVDIGVGLPVPLQVAPPHGDRASDGPLDYGRGDGFPRDEPISEGVLTFTKTSRRFSRLGEKAGPTAIYSRYEDSC